MVGEPERRTANLLHPIGLGPAQRLLIGGREIGYDDACDVSSCRLPEEDAREGHRARQNQP
jgi:hypothetical protein